MHARISRVLSTAALCATLTPPAYAATGVKISEWMYNGSEFIELTNFGPAAVDFAEWSFDDDSRTPGIVSLASLGTVAPGESVLIVEGPAADFRALWGLSASVKILGDNGTNLGRNDEINIFNGATLVDRLTFGDQNIPGTIRTQNVSGRPGTLAALGINQVSQWVLSAPGDVAGSYAVGGGLFVGNPGVAPVPEPETYAMMLAGLALLAVAVRRRRRGSADPMASASV